MESSSRHNIVLNVTFFIVLVKWVEACLSINGHGSIVCHALKGESEYIWDVYNRVDCNTMPSPSNSIPSNPWLHFNMERIQLRAEVTDRSKIILWKSRKETLAASFSQSRLLPGGKENWRFPPIINGVRGCWCFGTIIYCSFCKWWWYICYVFLVFVFTYQLKFDIRFDHHWVKIYVYSRKTPRK